MRSIVLGALLAVTAVVLASAAAHRSEAQSPSAPPFEAVAWEHRVAVLNYDHYRESREFRDILEDAGGDVARAVPAFEQWVLNELGRSGWELVQVERSARSETVYYLKRPRDQTRPRAESASGGDEPTRGRR